MSTQKIMEQRERIKKSLEDWNVTYNLYYKASLDLLGQKKIELSLHYIWQLYEAEIHIKNLESQLDFLNKL